MKEDVKSIQRSDSKKEKEYTVRREMHEDELKVLMKDLADHVTKEWIKQKPEKNRNLEILHIDVFLNHH